MRKLIRTALICSLAITLVSLPNEGLAHVQDALRPVQKVTPMRLDSFDDAAAYREAKLRPGAKPKTPQVRKSAPSAAKPKAQPFRGMAKSAGKAQKTVRSAVRSAGLAAKRIGADLQRGAVSGLKIARKAVVDSRAAASKALAVKRVTRQDLAAPKQVAPRPVKASLDQARSTRTQNQGRQQPSASKADGNNVAGYAKLKGKLTADFRAARDATPPKANGGSEQPPKATLDYPNAVKGSGLRP